MRDVSPDDRGSESIEKMPVVSRNSCGSNVKPYHDVKRNGHSTKATAMVKIHPYT